ncbi:MAG: pimeloyl-ACP methyl ester carboxylesterase, partial [Verrucomicrobiales bacterium]
KAAKEDVAKRSAKPLKGLQPPLAPPAVRRSEPGGGIVNLADARFGPEAAALGFSNANGFVKTHGTGGYLTDNYRSNKTPVLFIHGAGGDWRSVFSRLDLGRFQPLVYHYPAGAPFERSAEALHSMMGSVSKRYGFKSYHVVGHGTGDSLEGA